MLGAGEAVGKRALFSRFAGRGANWYKPFRGNLGDTG